MRFEVKKSENGQFYFNLIARNHEIIATSELYTQKHNALKTARLIAREQVFEIRDLTRDTPQTLLLDINGNIIRDGDSIYLRDTFWGDTEIHEVIYAEDTDELWYLDEGGLLGEPLEELIKLAQYEIEIVPEELGEFINLVRHEVENEWVNRVHTEENAKILLQDVYEFLESGNRHSHIEALEKLTGIFYEQEEST